MSQFHLIPSQFPILSFLIFSPMIFALILLFVSNPKKVKVLTLIAVLFEVILSFFLVFEFNSEVSGFQFSEKLTWLPAIGVNYHLGIDGISVLCFPMTALITLMILTFSWKSAAASQLFCAFLLLLEGITFGIFSSLNLILFFLFWEFMLVPIFFMIHIWGSGPDRRFAALKYVLYMLTASAPLLAAFVILATHHASLGFGYSFDLFDLLHMPLSHTLQLELFILLFIGFAVKAPLFPLHTWLPMVLEQGPIGIGIIMVGLKLGIYGFARFLIPLLPSASLEWQDPVLIVTMAGMFYGAIVALTQTNLKRLLTYSGLSHISLIVLGLFSFSRISMQGAILQMVNLGIISTMLFFMTGCIFSRIGTSDLQYLGGLASRAPKITYTLLFFSLASLGFPGTSGFIGEHFIFFGAFQAHGWFALAGLLGLILSSASLFIFFERALFGSVKNGPIDRIVDLQPREQFIAFLFAVIVLWVGLHPQPFLKISEKSIQALYSDVLQEVK